MCNLRNDNRVFFYEIKIYVLIFFTEEYTEPCQTSKMEYFDK